MGVGYSLVNATKRERVLFDHLSVEKAREITGNPASSAIVCWYLLKNQGDEIHFVSDSHDDWPFADGSKGDLTSYVEVTHVIIESLIEAGILKDYGISWSDDDDPDNIYERDIRNVWMDDRSQLE